MWSTTLADPERDAFRRALVSRVDVAVYTPGHPEGRGLALPVLPAGVAQMTSFEQAQVARTASQALAEMIGLRNGQRAEGKRAVLQKALEFLAPDQKDALSVSDLHTFVAEKDVAFLGDLGGLAKFVDELAIDLDIMLTRKRALLESGADRLDAGALLGRSGSGASDRTRLSIVSTKFMPSAQDEQFWVAQLLIEVYRWASKNPSNRLQAVLLLDEADKFLPATREPATKQPVENLLRRARSMGMGVMLATQNPGDFDYRCRDNILTWLVGRLTQMRGIEKIGEMFHEAHADTKALVGQKVGQFHLLTERVVTRLKVTRNSVSLPSQIPDDEILQLAAAGVLPASSIG